MRHDATRRIRREIQRNHLRPRRDRLLHILRHQRKLVFFTRLHHHRHTVGHLDARRIAHVARLMIDYFVSRIQHRPEGDVERLRHADGDEDLRLRVIGGAEVLGHVLADAYAQRFETEIRGVARLAFFQRADHRLTDRPRRRFVGLANA